MGIKIPYLRVLITRSSEYDYLTIRKRFLDRTRHQQYKSCQNNHIHRQAGEKYVSFKYPRAITQYHWHQIWSSLKGNYILMETPACIV